MHLIKATTLSLLLALSFGLPSLALAYQWPGKKQEALKNLQSSQASSRVRALQNLALFPPEEVSNLVIGALGDPNKRVRLTAIDVLVELRTPEAIPHLQALLNHHHAETRASAVQALGAFGDTRSLSPMLRALGDPFASVRAKTIEALGDLGSDAVWTPIASMLSDKDQIVVSAAISELGRSQNPAAVFPLLEKIKTSSDETQLNAIRALGRLKDPRATLPLLDLLHTGHSDLRIEVARTLGRIKDSRAVPSLIQVLWTEHKTDLGQTTIHALTQIASPKAAPALLKIARHSTSRGHALEAIQATGPEILPLILQTLQENTDRPFQESLLGTLQVLLFDPRTDQKARRQVAQVMLPELHRKKYAPPEIASILLATRDPQTLEPLLHFLLNTKKPASGQGHNFLREILLEGFIHYQDERIIAPLADLYPQLTRHEKKLALQAFGATRSPEAIPALARATRAPDEELQRTALRALGQINHPNSSAILLDFLEDPQDPRLHEAALALGHHTSSSIVERLLRLIQRGGSTRLRALRLLGDQLRQNRPSLQTTPLLLDLFQEKEAPLLALAALNALSITRPPEAVPSLKSRYPQAQLDLKTRILQALGDWAPPEGLDLLRNALHAEHPLLRAEAAWSLSSYPEHGSSAALVALLQDRAWPVSINAAASLARTPNPETSDALFQALHTTSGATRSNVLLSLHKLNQAPETPELIALYRKENTHFFRETLFRVLLTRKDPRSQEFRRSLLSSHPSLAKLAAEIDSPSPRKDTWVRYVLTELDKPISGEQMLVILPDGAIIARVSDLAGEVRVENISEGLCRPYTLNHEYRTD